MSTGNPATHFIVFAVPFHVKNNLEEFIGQYNCSNSLVTNRSNTEKGLIWCIFGGGVGTQKVLRKVELSERE